MSDTSEARAILHSSESAEWYTPREIIEAAREVMGQIELDPASCAEANETVRARRYYTAEVDGFRQCWASPAMWLNPPYGRDEDARSNQGAWLHLAINAHRAGYVEQACCLVNAVPGNKWFEPLWAFPLCFLRGRVRFVPPAGVGAKASPTHSSVVVYMGANSGAFVRVFGKLGTVILPTQVYTSRPQAELEF